jgi:DNA-binding SARP family transcriptional activator
LLGGLTVDEHSERDFGSRKARTLVKLLALARGAPVSTERIAEVLWGDLPPARPAEQVGVLVSRVRAVVGADHLTRRDGGYALAVDWLDVDELVVRATEAAAALAEGRSAAARVAADAALALDRGELAPDEDGAWIDGERARVRQASGRAAVVAAEAALAAGDADGAAVIAAGAVAADPYDETALRVLMGAHAAANRPASALAAYAAARTRLIEDLGVSPTAQTEALHTAILTGDVAAPPIGSVGAPAGLLGRQQEMSRLRAHFEAVRTGGAELVIVEGEAGIGKSTLVAAFAAEVVSAGALLLRGGCDELGRDLPIQPIVDAVADVVRAGGVSVDDSELIALLEGRHLDPAASAVTVDAANAQARLFAALLALVHRLAAERVCVVVIEDIHLAGPGTMGWLSFARRRGDRLLVVATRRPPGAFIPGAPVVTVSPFDPATAATLIGSGHDDVVVRARGNPLLLLTLRAAPKDEVPASLRDLFAAQARALGSAGSALLTAAILGSEVDLDLLAELLARPAVDVLADLEAAAAARLLDESASGFVFRHALIREALEESAGSARRALVHRDAARALARRPDADALAVAVHARLGGDSARAAAAYTAAAQAALARFDTAEALSYLTQSLALVDSAEAHVARARVHMSLLDNDKAADDAQCAVGLDPGSASLEMAAWVAYYRRRYDEARTYADSGIARAGGDPARLASCLAVAGRVRHGSGDLSGAVEQLERSTGAPPAIQGVLDVWLAQARVHQGRPLEGIVLADRALVDGARLAHPFAPFHGRFARIMAFGYCGRLADALAACDEMDVVSERAGAAAQRFPAMTANCRGWLLRAAGRRADADESNERAFALSTGHDGGPRSDAFAEMHYVSRLDLVEARFTAGDLDSADRLVAGLAVVDTWTGAMSWHQRHRLGLFRARLALADGRADDAIALADAVALDAAARGALRYEWLARGWVAVAGGDGDGARVANVIDGLGRAAALDSWRLVYAIGQKMGVEEWCREAERRAAALVTMAGPLADDMRRAVSEGLGS